MANASARQIEEIESRLLHSNQSSEAASVSTYAALLLLQERFANDPGAMKALAHCSSRVLPVICSDASDNNEEIAAQALKCLGFMVYHPSLVSAIPEGVADLVMESLVKLITTTKMKAICNLGVWCISIQQLNASFISRHLHSLLGALIYAIDNPLGSLSTTFEAIQAIMKLTTQLSEMMRDLSNIWAPPLYKRLLSIDKKERDMTERCILKITSSIFPPTLSLSKAIVADLKSNLLQQMQNMLKDFRRRLHVIQAWGWYMRLLGSRAIKNRHLVNEMLKIPGKTFSDPDPQVQIATQVAWEGLIDALIEPPLLVWGSDMATGHVDQQNRPVSSIRFSGNCEIQSAGLSKSIKLIMTPILGVLSGKCDISVRLSCLSTWHYFLHKLNFSVNHSSVVKAVLEPTLEIIFKLGVDNTNFWLWNLCVDLLNEFISAKIRFRDDNLDDLLSSCTPTKITSHVCILYKDSWKDYPIKWLPWDLCKLDFYLKMIRILISQGLTISTNLENRKLVLDTSLRIFVAVLKGVQVELKRESNGFDEIFLGINTVLKFARWASEEMTSKFTGGGTGDLLSTAVQFVEAVKEELEPSMLASPLYRVVLDLEFTTELQFSDKKEYPTVPGINFAAIDTITDMVSPMVYLTIIYLSLVVHSVLYLSGTEMTPYTTQYSKFVFSLSNASEYLHATISLLYKHGQKLIQGAFSLLEVWKAVTKGLKEYIDTIGNLNFVKIESDSTGHALVYWFLCYPFAICYYSQKLSASVTIACCPELHLVSSHRPLEIEDVIEVWKLLFDSANCASQLCCSHINSFSEGLCKVLTTVFDDNIIVSGGSNYSCFKEENQASHFIFLFGEVAIHLLKQIQVLDGAILQSRGRSNQEEGKVKECNHMKHSLGFVSRFLQLSMSIIRPNLSAVLALVSRVFAAMTCIVEHLFLKQDVLLLMETIVNPLERWLSIPQEMLEGEIIRQLQCFWVKILECLRRVQEPIIFDSSFLSIQAPLMQTTLNHPYFPISDATISFFKSTYDEQSTLLYPKCLLTVLEKLSREGRMDFHKGSSPFLVNNDDNHISKSTVTRVSEMLQIYRVSATQQRKSKRVELTQDNENEYKCADIASLDLQTKRLKSTVCVREVRVAHQGGESCCNGNSSRVRRYTELQDGHELRNSKLILDLLRRS